MEERKEDIAETPENPDEQEDYPLIDEIGNMAEEGADQEGVLPIAEEDTREEFENSSQKEKEIKRSRKLRLQKGEIKEKIKATPVKPPVRKTARKNIAQKKDRPGEERAQKKNVPSPDVPRKNIESGFGLLDKIIIIIAILIIIFGITGLVLINSIEKKLSDNGLKPTSPATVEKGQVSLYYINYSGCQECDRDIAAFKSQLEAQNLIVKDEKYYDYENDKGVELLQSSKITHIPAFLIRGDIDNLSLDNFARTDDTLVQQDIPAPYYDLEQRKIIGRVTAINLIDSSCKECMDLSILLTQLRGIGIDLYENMTIDITTTEGKRLLSKYTIEKVPTVLLDKEAGVYPALTAGWSQIGSIEEDGMYVLRNVTPPYKNMKTGSIEGLVRVTYLIDKSCVTCYNVTLHKAVLVGRLGLKIDKEQTVDIAETDGQNLIKSYAITAVPTIIVSSDASVYAVFSQIWNIIGTQEKDGSFVFRNMAALNNQVYKNLTNNETVNSLS
ncbi:MAG: hypothetical protein V1743_00655 [Nanoarchaeota archaeon]